MANNRVEYTLAFTADTSKAKQQLQSLQGQITGLINNASLNNKSHLGMTKEIQEASAAAAQLKTQLAAATNVNTGKLDLAKFNQSLKSSGMNLDKYRQALVKLGPQGAQTFANLAASITNAEAPIIRVNSHLKKMGDTLLNTARWQLSSSLMNSFVGAVQGAYGYAQDLDKSLTNIRIVTEKSADDMARFAKQANKAAKELGTTTTKYTDAALIYYQQGLTDDQVKQRTDTTIKMANVTGENATEVSSYMTAIWNNFAKGGENLEYFADVITALGAATAASSEEIAGGLEKFAAVGETVGLSYEYATAALTTIIDKTRQSEDVVGTALKTIFARIQGLQQGEETEDGVTLNKYSQALENVGISIMDNNGELKKMDDILDEMGAKWATMSKAQQVALAQTVGGTRQYTQLIALMENWTAMQENLNTAYGASGALEKQNEIYEESWQASANRVKAAWEELYDTILNSDFFIKFNDTLAKIIDLVDILINSLGGVGGVVTAIGVIFMKVYQQQIAKGLTSLGTSMATFFKTNKKDMDDLQKKASESLTKLEVAGAGKVFALQADAQKAYLAVADQLGEEEKERAKILLEQHSAMVSNTIELAKQKEILEKQANMQFFGARRRAQQLDSDEGLDITANEDAAKIVNKYAPGSGNTWEAALNTFKELSTQAATLHGVVENLFGPRTINSENFDAVKEQLINNFNALQAEMEESGSTLEKTFGSEAAAIFKNLETALKNPALSAGELNQILDALAKHTEIFTTDTGILGQALESEGVLLKNQSSLWSKIGENISKIITGKVNLRISTDGLKTSFQELNVTLKTSSQYMVQIAQHTASIVSATMAISRLKETWNEETDMSFGERLGSTVTTLGFALPMLSSGITGLSKDITDWAVKLGGTGKAVETVGGSLKVIFTSLGSSIAGFLATAWPFLIAIALITAALGAFYLAYTKDARELERANEALEKQQKVLDETTNAWNKIKQTIENYNKTQAAIDDLTEGTQAWRDAISDANAEVLNLLDTYPELAQYVKNVDGRLTIQKEGLDLLESAARNRVNAEQNSLYIAKLNKLSAENKSNKTNTQREIIIDYNGYGNRDSTYTQDRNPSIRTEDLNKVLEGMKIHGEALLTNREQLKSLGITDERVIDAIIDNAGKIVALNSGIEANTVAIELLRTEVAKNFLGENLTGERKAAYENSDYKDYIAEYYGKQTGEGSEAYQSAMNEQNTKTTTQIGEEYAENQGYGQVSKVESKDWGNTIVIHTVDGESYTVDRNNAKKTNATVSSQEKGLEAGGVYDQSINELNSIAAMGTSPEASEALVKGFVQGFDVSALSDAAFEQIEQLYTDGTLKNSGKYTDKELDNLGKQIEDYSSEEGKVKRKENRIAAMNANQESLASSYGMDVAGLEKFQEQLPGVNDLIEEGNELGIKATKIALKWSKDGGKVADVLNDQKDALKDKDDIVNYNKALKAVADATSDWLGMDVDSDFVEKNMELITAAANGSKEAMLSLRKEATKDYYFNLNPEVDKEALSTTIDSIYDTISTLDVGTIDLLDPTNKKLWDDLMYMANLMGWGAEKAAEEFKKKYNIDIPIDYKWVPYTNVVHNEATGLNDIKDENGNVIASVDTNTLMSYRQDGGFYVPHFGEGASQATFAGVPSTPPTSTKKSSKSGGSKKEKKKAKDELNKFREEERALSTLEKQLDRISKAKDRAYGKDKLKKMDEEIAKYEELAKAQQKLIDEVQTDFDEKRAAAASIGAKFDPTTGEMTNSEEILEAALNKFNNSGRTEKDEEEYNRIKEILDEYEEAHDRIMDEEDKLQEYLDSIMDAKIAKIQYQVEVKIEIEDQKLEYLDYLLSKLEDKEFSAAQSMAKLSEQTQSWLNKYNANVKGLYDTINKLGISLDDAIGIMTGSYTQEQIDALGLTKEQIETIRNYGKEFINIAENLDKLKEAHSQELIDAIQEGIDAFDEIEEKINHVTSTLEHYKNIIDIIGQDTLGVSTEQMLDLMQTAVDSSVASLANAQETLTYLQAQRKAIEDSDLPEDEKNKQLKDIDAKIRDAEASVQSGLEGVLNTIVEQFSTSLELATKEFEKSMSGAFGSLEKLQEAFDRQKEIDNLYVDDYKKIYELTKLTRDINKSIDETDNIKAKQALKDLQKEINDLQKDGTKLSEYDIEMLNKKYELRLAEIALEDAQNAKSQVRMTRDSEGNWSYTYTADENSIAEAEQNYEDKLYAAQEANQEYIKNLQDQIISSYAAMMQAIKQLGPDATQEEINAIRAHYEAIMEAQTQQMENAMSDSNEILGFMKSETEGWINSFDETTLSALTGYQTMEEYQNAFGAATTKMMSDISAAMTTYQTNIKTAMDTCGLSVEDFGKRLEAVLNGEGGIKDQIDGLETETTDLVDTVSNNVSTALDSLAGFYSTYSEKVALATAETWGLKEAIQALIDAEPDELEEEPEPEQDPKPEQPTGPTWSRVKSAYNKIHTGAWGTGAKRYSDGKADGYTEAEIKMAQKLINLVYGGMSMEAAKTKLGFFTGGYTGEWGASGKLAFLHEKELVLNAEDTQNMLKSIEMVRAIAQTIDLNSGSTLGWGGLSSMGVGNGKSEIVQEITINAEFPYATERNEIEAAFDSLFIRASQYANRK